MPTTLWEKCLGCLQDEFPVQQFNTWIRPLQAEHVNNQLTLYAPNRFVVDWIKDRFLGRITELVKQLCENEETSISLEIGNKKSSEPAAREQTRYSAPVIPLNKSASMAGAETPPFQSNLNQNFTFDNFVEGKSNQLAKAASQQVGENPAVAYNPLYLYGGVGLGKTHLLHAIGNHILPLPPNS